MGENDLQDRLFRFALESREAQAAVSRSDFGYKISISLKEMRESNYWLRILGELYKQNSEIERLIKESIELKNILGSISVKVSPRK